MKHLQTYEKFNLITENKSAEIGDEIVIFKKSYEKSGSFRNLDIIGDIHPDYKKITKVEIIDVDTEIKNKPKTLDIGDIAEVSYDVGRLEQHTMNAWKYFQEDTKYTCKVISTKDKVNLDYKFSEKSPLETSWTTRERGAKYEKYNESLFSNKWNSLQKKVLSDIGINLYFVSTFGLSVAAFYPFFDNIIKNSNIKNTFTSTDIILLTLCALSMLFKENKSNIDKLKTVISEKGLKEFLPIFISTLTNIEKLFQSISKNFNKTINGLTDMFSYTAILVPFTIGLLKFIELYNIGLENFNDILINPVGISISLGIGVVTLSMKHLVNMLLKHISRVEKKSIPKKYNNEFSQSFESVDIICENYFNL